MQAKYSLSAIFVLATVLICCAEAIRNAAKEADDDRRQRMCIKYDYNENNMRSVKSCTYCCYDDGRNIDDTLSRESKSCICSNSAEFDTDEDEGQAYDIEDEVVEQIKPTITNPEVEEEKKPEMK